MSQKFIPKNLRKPIKDYKDSTWLANGKPVWENESVSVWKDRFPLTPGHTLFIPKKDDVEHVQIAYGLAYGWAKERVDNQEWDGFNIGQNIGLCAGQTVLWPHIHVIPRFKNDTKGAVGGIRRSHPSGDHKEYY